MFRGSLAQIGLIVSFLKEKLEILPNFFFACPSFRENFNLLWSNLGIESMTDVTHIAIISIILIVIISFDCYLGSFIFLSTNYGDDDH